MTKFQGFQQPEQNWSKLPHELVDVMGDMNGSVLKIVLYTLRHTWGFQDKYKRITIDEYCNGRKRRDGSRIDNGTKLARPTVISALATAVADGFLFEVVDDYDKARIKKYYGLNYFEIPGLENLTPTENQGLKNLTPEVKKSYPGGKKTLPRTEKETIEKETIEKESPHSQKIQKTDPLTHMLEATAQVEANKAEKENAAWLDTFGYRDEFLAIFAELTGRKPNQVEKGFIADLAAEDGASVNRWRLAMTEAILNDSRAHNRIPAARFAEVYRAGGTWHKFKVAQGWVEGEKSKPPAPGGWSFGGKEWGAE